MLAIETTTIINSSRYHPAGLFSAQPAEIYSERETVPRRVCEL